MSFMRRGRHPSLGIFVAILLAACTAAVQARAGDLVFLDEFDGPVSIPWVRQNAVFAEGASFVVQPAIVTATKLTNSNAFLTLFVQLPENLASPPYPQWAAIEGFGNATGTVPALGDCVQISGKVTFFKGITEISSMTWTAATAIDCGNGTVVPTTVSLSDIATDATAGVSGNQPGPSAEAYESALLRVQNVAASTSSVNGIFNVYSSLGSSDTYLSVDDFLYAYPAVVSTHFTSISGVLEQFDSASDTVYLLLPRDASDVVVGP